MIIHWVSCAYFIIIHSHWVQLNQGKEIAWNYNYWIPQVDMARAKSEFHIQEKTNQYLTLIYFSILLVTGNDIMPSNMSEYTFCIFILIIGAFMEAYVIGGITAEISKSGDKVIRNTKIHEYVKYSL